MATSAIYEAEDSMDQLLDRVEAGEEIVITRHGKPSARLVRLPVVTETDQAKARAALAEISAMAIEAKSGPFIWEEWKAYRDEGRK